MPLYIDLHIDNSLTPEVIKKCHVADKAIQERYGVRYLQILLNQPQGYLFCLVEGPDKESCAKCHAEAHGSIACNVIEITNLDFQSLLAGKNKDSFDFTLNTDGTIDTGNRALLTVSLLGTVKNYRKGKDLIKSILKESESHNPESFGNALVAVFDSVSGAIDSSLLIRKKIAESAIPVEVRMGINFGSPLEEKGNYFEDVFRLANRFSFVSQHGEITLSSKVMQLYNGDIDSVADSLKVVNHHDEKFLNRLMDCAEKFWDSDISIAAFAEELGMSKSQLTRKLQTLANLSPNDFLKELRLRNSIRLIEDKNMNVGEVTMATGFSNPSYFTKCFRKRFGMAPSEFVSAA
jgi:AraC-like DNA-binding protein